MTQQRGSTCVLTFDTEATYKTTPVAPDAVKLPFVSETIEMKRDLVESQTRMTGRNPKRPGRGKVDVGGDISFELAPQYGRFFKHVFGGYGVTGASAPYTHTYKIGDLPAGMVIEKSWPDISKFALYNGCKINAFKMSVAPSGLINCSASIIGAKETVSGTSFDASATDLGHTPFDGFGASIKQGGSTLGIVTKLDLTLDNGLDPDGFVIDGTGERASLPDGMGRATGTVTVLFTATTLYELAIAHTETSLELHLVNGAGTGASAGNEKMSFYLDELVFTPKTPGSSGPKGLLCDLNFIGYYDDDADASALRMVLLSPSATY